MHISKEHSRKRRQVCVRAKGARAKPDGDEERATKKKAGRGEEHELTQCQGLASHGRHLRALGVALRGFEQRKNMVCLSCPDDCCQDEKRFGRTRAGQRSLLTVQDGQTELFIHPFLMRTLSICFLMWQKQVYLLCLPKGNSSTSTMATSCVLRVILSVQPRLPLGLNVLRELLNCA